MFESIGFVIAGLILLVFGGEVLVRSASRIADTLGVSPLVIGLTVVAFGTSAPELGVSLFAALQGSPEIALSNVIGSNIFNIGVVLGVCALIRPLIVQVQLIKFDVPVLVILTLLSYGFAFNKSISLNEGIILFSVTIGYTVWLIRSARREDVPNELVDIAINKKKQAPIC